MGKHNDPASPNKEKPKQQLLARMHLAEHAAQAGMWDWDFATNRQFWSASLFVLFGLDAEKTTPSVDVWRRLVHPEDLPCIHQAFADSLENHLPYTVNYRIVRPSGEIRWISVHGQAYYDPSGLPIRFTGICLDTTESRAIENLIIESEQRFRNLFDHLPLAYQSLDIEGNWLDCNQHMADLLGFESPAQMIGQSFIDHLHEATPVEFHVVFDQFKAFNTVNRDTVLRRKDGQLITVNISGQVQRDVQERFIRTHCVVVDISERHAKEQAVFKQNAELERRVDERTQALKESEKRVKLILESCPVAILVLDEQGVITETNTKASELFRCQPEDLLGQPATSFAPSLSKPENLASDGKLVWQPIPSVREIMATTVQGDEIQLEVGLEQVSFEQQTFLIAALNDITIQRQAEDELKETREILERAQSVAKLGSWQFFKNHDTFKISKEAARLFGFGDQAIVSADERYAKIHPDDRQRAIDAWQAALSGAPYAIEYRIIVDGQIKQIRSTAEFTFDDSGRCVAALGIVQDVTELTQTQQALQRQHTMLETILQYSPNGLALFDNHNNLVKYNQKYLDLVGYPRELIEQGKVNTKDFLDYLWQRGEFKGTSFDAVKEKFATLISSRQSFEEYREISNGNTVYVHTLFLEEGWFLVSYNDITHIKQVEQKNWEITQRLMLAAKASGVGVWVWHLADNTVIWDSRMHAMYGIEETLGQLVSYDTWAARLHPDDAAETTAALALAVEQGKEFSKTFRIVLPSGEVKYIGSNSTLELDPTGKPIRMIGTNFDLTDHFEQQKALQAAKQAADAANQAKSTFLANMSHEIRSPLNGIIGLSELLQQSELDAQQSQFANKINSSGKILLNLVNDILDFSKIEAGHLSLNHQPFSLLDELEKSLDLFYIAIKEKSLTVQTEVADNVPLQLVGDGMRLGQVFNNLLGNAVKFTQNGTIGIKIENISGSNQQLSGKLSARVKLRFSVTDSGIGLSEQQQQRLFQSFVQADNTISQRFGGTGLGLAICKKLVELMGGDISVTSVLGQGSTFTFTAGFDCPSLEFLPAPPPLITNQPASNLQGLEILVVDDNRVNQLVARGFLEKQGLQASVANSAPDAIEWVSKKTFAAVLMDIQMPGMNGYEATRQIRSLPEGQDIPIIALTASVTEECIKACEEAGMNGHLSKPLDSGQLADCLARLVVSR